MTVAYVQTVARLGWLVCQIEDALGELDNGAVVSIRVIRRLARDRLPSDEEASAVIGALESIGILRHNGMMHRLDRPQLVSTNQYRCGVREALAYKSSQPTESVTLCIALPVGLDPTVTQLLQREAVDLRAALLDIVVSARERIVLASPFWDAETAAELAELLSRRLIAGVRVDLLGRFEEPHDQGSSTLLAHLSRYPSCRLYSWYIPSVSDRFGSQTFHFKAAAADNGEKVYVGTANLTVSGLRSRMELGVVLNGELGRKVVNILDIVLKMADPV